ncbi:hypothetical protein TL16_g08207 [Triparma laevis f. inornata]|uniref:Uncharacterized protein n=1 Tax=Triparma laevis f. inornata TaxID=1714386 RepID=A0A9W7B4V9_9STRA|nr:hypothetical protein TL16_g08207 [Triparma laevis f. inornata]
MEKVSKPKSCCDSGCSDDDQKEDEIASKIKKGKKARQNAKLVEVAKEKGFFGEIKLLPLVFLFLLTASTALPAFFWILDNASSVLVKTNLTGQLGYRMGIGSTPRKRITSFYEKHSPEKLGSVDATLGKYYGDYKTLTRKLERKYSDYGYFVGWEEDEAASKLAWAKIEEYQKDLSKTYRKNAPKQLVQASDNFYYNIGGITKKVKVIWKKQIWPVLKPIVWVADEKEAKRQKKADAKKYGKKKKGSAAFRDEEDEDVVSIPFVTTTIVTSLLPLGPALLAALFPIALISFAVLSFLAPWGFTHVHGIRQFCEFLELLQTL